MTKNPFISFIIPVYNEEENIKGVFRDLFAILHEHPEWKWEVIVVEDGSRDQTKSVIQGLIEEYPEAQAIWHEENQGWVRSMKDGLKIATGQYIMYIGADEEFDCSELPSFVDALLAPGQGPDVVLGVRWQRNAYKLHRFFLSVIYIFWLNAIFNIRINDYNWSQIWSRKLLNRIQIKSKSLFMLPEIILKAHDLGMEIKEIPSNHRGRRRGKSSLNLGIFAHAVNEAIQFWFERRSKVYRKKMATSSPSPAFDPQDKSKVAP